MSRELAQCDYVFSWLRRCKIPLGALTGPAAKCGCGGYRAEAPPWWCTSKDRHITEVAL